MHVIKKEERDLMDLLKKFLKKKAKKREAEKEEWSATSAMEAEEELRAMSKKTLGM